MGDTAIDIADLPVRRKAGLLIGPPYWVNTARPSDRNFHDI